MSKLWYLLRYHYGQAERAIMNLEYIGVNCFSPRVKKHYPGMHKKNRNEGDHLFPPYVFVEFNPEEIQYSSVQYAPGVCGFVRFGQALKAVPADVINMLLTPGQTEQPSQSPLLDNLFRCQDKSLRTMMFLSLVEKIQNGELLRLRPLN